MSPIKGLSEQRRMPRLGKIHLGIKVKNASGVEYPKATDYFVCGPEVQKVFGEEPKELEILFPTEDELLFAPQYYKYYNASFGLVCKGDGENCTRRTDIKTGKTATKESVETTWTSQPCTGQECPMYKNDKCKEMMNLQFMIPQVPGLGVYQLDTGSVFGIMEINSGVEMIRKICGRIAGIPLKLSIAPETITPKGGKKKTVYLLKLSSNVTLAEVQRIAALPIHMAMLPAPDESRPDLLLGPFPEDELMAKASRPEIPVPEEDMDILWEDPKPKAVPCDGNGVVIEQTSDEAFEQMESANLPTEPVKATTQPTAPADDAPNKATKRQCNAIAELRTNGFDFDKTVDDAGYPKGILPPKLTVEQAEYIILKAIEQGFTTTNY